MYVLYTAKGQECLNWTTVLCKLTYVYICKYLLKFAIHITFLTLLLYYIDLRNYPITYHFRKNMEKLYLDIYI